MLQVAQIAVYTTHKYSVGRTYNCWMLKLLVHHVTRMLMRSQEYQQTDWRITVLPFELGLEDNTKLPTMYTTKNIFLNKRPDIFRLASVMRYHISYDDI
jgi:hypothetical protein